MAPSKTKAYKKCAPRCWQISLKMIQKRKRNQFHKCSFNYKQENEKPIIVDRTAEIQRRRVSVSVKITQFQLVIQNSVKWCVQIFLAFIVRLHTFTVLKKMKRIIRCIQLTWWVPVMGYAEWKISFCVFVGPWVSLELMKCVVLSSLLCSSLYSNELIIIKSL